MYKKPSSFIYKVINPFGGVATDPVIIKYGTE
jgi:hypothetical protein